MSISALVGISHEPEAKREEEGLGKEAEGRRGGEDTAWFGQNASKLEIESNP